MKICSLGLGFLMLLALPCVTLGQIYEWVDEKGVKHYSNEPPPDGVEVFSQSDEIQTDESQIEEQEQSDLSDRSEPEAQATESESAPQQAEGAAAEQGAPDTVVGEDEEREAFQRERIKQRTQKNTSPAPSLQEQRERQSSRNPAE